MFKFCCNLLAMAVACLAAGAPLQAGTVPLNDTQDAFTYPFLGSYPYESSDPTQPSLQPFFPGILAVSNDGVHSVESFVEFGGLAGTGLTASQVTAATLTVTVGASAGFGPGPSASAPVAVDLYPANGPWNESISFDTQPGIAGFGLITQVTDSDATQTTMTFNVLSVVQAWLAGSLPNNGFIFTQDNPGTQSMTFDSMGTASPPVLTLTTNIAPEPGSLTLAGMAALGAVLWRFAGRKRRGAAGQVR